MKDDPIHYRIYLDPVNKRLNAVSLQHHDERDYISHRFVMSEGKPLTFDTQEGAIKYLNTYFKIQYIDPDSLSPGNQEFWKGEKT